MKQLSISFKLSIRFVLITFLFLYPMFLFAQLHNPSFMEHWQLEDESHALQAVGRGDTLELVVPEGLTMWYKQRLMGDYEVSYQIFMVMKGGKYDRLSDLNCFWAANDPQFPDNLFARSEWRNGVFKNYNTLNLFYVGYGGNENTTTRFRRYHGEYYGKEEVKIKPLLNEYTDAAHLLFPNQWYQIQIRVEKGITTYLVNGEELFRYTLVGDRGDGHFGLRLLQNHVLFTGFRVTIL